MLELTQITTENAKAFRALIRTDAYPFLADEATLGLGLVDKDTPIGALVMRPDGEGAANLLSVAIAEPYRRKGFATELLAIAADIYDETGEIYRITCETTRQPGEKNGLYGLLNYLEFDIEETDSGCFVTSFGEIRKQKLLQSKGEEAEAVSYENMTQKQRKLLYEEEMDLKPLMDAGCIEENLSCVTFSDNAIDSCLIFAREEEELTVQWARTSPKNPSALVHLIRYAIAHSKAYTDEELLYIPVLNGESKRLTEKLFGKELKKAEAGYRAVLPLR